MLNCFKDYKRCIHISYHIFDFVQQKRPNSLWSNATCHLYYTANTVLAEALVTEVARASAGMVLTK